MPTEIEISVKPIFSTPLVVFTVAEHAHLNADLARLILQREASEPTYSDYEVVGWSSPHDLSMLEWAGGPLKEFFGPVIEVAKQMTEFSERSGQAERRPEHAHVEVVQPQ